LDWNRDFQLSCGLRSFGLPWYRLWFLRWTSTLCTDSFEQHACRFIGGVLRHKFTLESAFENRLAQSISAFEVRGDGGFEFVNDGETSLNLSDNTALFIYRRERNWDLS
jgi:hypothetical protein